MPGGDKPKRLSEDSGCNIKITSGPSRIARTKALERPNVDSAPPTLIGCWVGLKCPTKD